MVSYNHLCYFSSDDFLQRLNKHEYDGEFTEPDLGPCQVIV